MAQELFANNAESSLASGVTSTGTSFTLVTGEGSRFPAAVTGTSQFRAVLVDGTTIVEYVTVTNRSGDVLTVTRESEDATRFPKAARAAGVKVIAIASSTALGLIGLPPGGTTGQIPAKTSSADYASAWATPSLTLITSTVLGASAATITLSSIPGTYSHLRLVVVARCDRAATNDGLLMRLNGDTGSNYDYEIGTAKNATASAAASVATSVLSLGNLPGNSASAGLSSGVTADFPRYAGTAFHKNYTALAGEQTATTASTLSINMIYGRWLSTSAITSITLLTNNGSNFVTGTAVYLYGIT